MLKGFSGSMAMETSFSGSGAFDTFTPARRWADGVALRARMCEGGASSRGACADERTQSASDETTPVIISVSSPDARAPALLAEDSLDGPSRSHHSPRAGRAQRVSTHTLR